MTLGDVSLLTCLFAQPQFTTCKMGMLMTHFCENPVENLDCIVAT